MMAMDGGQSGMGNGQSNGGQSGEGNGGSGDWRLTAIVVLVALQTVMLWGISGRMGELQTATAGGVQAPALQTTDDNGGDREEGRAMAEWRVSGAGDGSYNGDYSAAGTHNGQPYYTGGSPTRYLYYGGELWGLATELGSFDPAYQSAGAELPGNPWAVYLGTPPAPVVSAIEEPENWVSIADPRGVTYEAPATAPISAIRARLRSTGEKVSVQGAIYDSTDDSLVATTAITQAGTDGWVTLAFDSPPTLTEGVTYYLLVWGASSDAQVGIIGLETNAWAEVSEESWNSWAEPGDLEQFLGGGSYMVEAADGWMVREWPGGYAVTQRVDMALQSAYGVMGRIEQAWTGAYAVTHRIEVAWPGAYQVYCGKVWRQWRGSYAVTTPITKSWAGSYADTRAVLKQHKGSYAVTRRVDAEYPASYAVEGGGGTGIKLAVLQHYMSEGRVL